MNGIRRLKRPLLAIGLTGALFSYVQVHKIEDKLGYIRQKLETNGKVPILELSTKQSAFFPWEFDATSLDKEDWEFRRVQVKGGLFATRHLVRRDKGDRPGYLVFAGMPTAQQPVKELEHTLLSEATIGAQKGIVVCLGWVPLEAKDRVIGDYMVQNDVVLIEDLYENAKVVPQGRFKDPSTGFIYETTVVDDTNIPIDNLFDDSENPDYAKVRTVLGEAIHPSTDDPSAPEPPKPLPNTSEMHYWGPTKLPTYQGYYHMRGYLRKGEADDWLLGRVNKGIRNINKVDVAKIAGFYRFRNPSAYEYYIDRSTDNDQEYNNLLPQPNHLSKGFEHLEPFEKDSYYDGYKKAMKWSSALAVLGLLI